MPIANCDRILMGGDRFKHPHHIAQDRSRFFVGIVYVEIRPYLYISQLDDTVDMIGHDNKRIQADRPKTIGQIVPDLLYHLASIINIQRQTRCWAQIVTK